MRDAVATAHRADPAHDRLTIVVADDDVLVREALVALFDDHPGFRVVAAVASGAAAAEQCAAELPALAIVDVMMPTGGAAAVTAIRAVSPDTTVVAYTARADRRTCERLCAAGAAAVFAKGGVADLAAALEELLASNRQSPPAR